MKIAIASDHGGFELKETIGEALLKKGIETMDFGTFSEESVDYPDFALKVGEAINNKEADLGILVCGTGIGMSIAANKIDGIRCALCSDVYSAKMTRGHNNANVLALGQRVLGDGLAMMIVDTFINSHFEGGRHQRRLDKIKDIENGYKGNDGNEA
ncbi:ribose-5-phosphate isomerase [endosymbiont 'TC1' of Trimyema compressum]|uniref:ribose 5-phosphate isomerase B n=1 Tax=endosymbiont 'TC1' of Trimyema compressum TaxID=243899 RepID=UPI0007F06A6B|nr:ribose 5-phosphate isomerase B [endosymbiont 'TC1' of Trimyema compressum]AMP19791.1 ribose-5-phosphate isomerase [endosymbiont 'TC1' of Trimyema compressum]